MTDPYLRATLVTAATKGASMRKPLAVLVVVIGVLAIGAPVWLAWPLIVGYEGTRVETPMPAHDLVVQVTDITKYMQGLATSVLGLIGFLLSQRVSNYWDRLSTGRRLVVIAGAFLCALSICVGLLVYGAVLSLSADDVVRSGLEQVLLLNLIQALELCLGVLLIGSTVLSALGAPPSRSPAEVLAKGLGGQS